ncbi:MAG TPA: hypothetical protein VGE57_08740 [Solimonas sp.]
MSAYPEHVTLREIDTLTGRAKGTAFRAFKALASTLREGVDFHVLNESQPEALSALRRQGRLYSSSVRAILLSPAAARRVADATGPAVTRR